MDTSSLFLAAASTFLFSTFPRTVLLLRLVVRPGTQSVDWDELFLAVRLLLIPFVFSSSRRRVTPVRERGGGFWCSVSHSLSHSLFVSPSPVVFSLGPYQQSIGCTDKTPWPFTINSNVNMTFSLTGTSNNSLWQLNLTITLSVVKRMC